jgi:hypothetical protein
MVVACWSAKGGVGTTLVAATLALEAARAHDGAVIVDCCGDLPAVFGMPEPDPDVMADVLAAGAVPRPMTLAVADGLRLLPARWVSSLDGPALVDWVRATEAGGLPVVVDCGRLDGPPVEPVAAALADAADQSLLVTRACYLALRRASTMRRRATGVVLVREPGRALGPLDVEEVLGAPVVAEVPVDPAVSRSVDAGLLAARMPAVLGRALRGCP